VNNELILVLNRNKNNAFSIPKTTFSCVFFAISLQLIAKKLQEKKDNLIIHKNSFIFAFHYSKYQIFVL